MRRILETAIFGAILLSFGCRGPTGLPADKKVSELSEDEKGEVCDNIADYWDKKVGEEAIKKQACVIAAVIPASLAGGDVDVCETAYQDCLANSSEATGDTTCEVSDAPSCDATIGEYDDCLEEQIDAFKDFIDGFNCTSALAMSGEETAGPVVGPACMALSQKCPELFNGM